MLLRLVIKEFFIKFKILVVSIVFLLGICASTPIYTVEYRQQLVQFKIDLKMDQLRAEMSTFENLDKINLLFDEIDPLLNELREIQELPMTAYFES